VILAIASHAAALLLAGAGDPPAAVATGYLLARAGWTERFSEGDPAAPPAAALQGPPRLGLLTEGNVQLRVAPSEGYDLFADLSLFANMETPATGPLAGAGQVGNALVPSELYVNLGFDPHFTGLAGRKRLIWGSGFAWNPSDMLNPPKDPTDPLLQRAGAWMVRAEAPFERFTATALWAPKVTAVQSGLPRRFLWPVEGGEAEQLFAARLYLLAADADLNLFWFWSNRYADPVAHSHRAGASASRIFFRDLELHFEALVQRGRDAARVRPECLPAEGGSLETLAACVQAGVAPIARTELASDAVYLKAIAGGRWTFADDSFLSAEYAYDGAGLDGREFGAQQRLLSLLPALLDLSAQLPPEQRAALPDPAALLFPGAAGQPVRFAFSPQRRHYLFLVFQKPRIADDFTVSATLIAGLEDRSGLFAPSLTWSAREWLGLSLLAFVPFGPTGSELASLPFRFRALLEARVWY
jgi:hypothetical protein